MATMNGNVEELKAQGYKPCPGCGAYYNPADPNVKDWHCSNCGADLTLSPEEAAAVRLNDAELAGQLAALNQKANTMKILALVCVIAVFVLWIAHPLLGAAMFIPAAVFAVMSASAGSKAKTLLANNITRDILSGVFDECIYGAQYRLPDETLRETGLFKWDRASGSDLISAKYKGHTVNFSDIELEEEVESEDSDGNTTTSYVTKFKGQWMILELGREVPAKLRLRENIERTGKLSRKLFGDRIENKSDVTTENEAFNKRFQILTEDPHSAFYILTPHFMEFITHADNAANAETDLCFIENRVHIACHTGKDSFELQKNDGANLDAVRARMKSELRYITSIADELLQNEYLFGRTDAGGLE